MGLINERLSSDINQILQTPNRNIRINLKATLHTPKKDINLQWLESFTLFRDYNSSIGDYAVIEFRVTADVYKGDIETFKDNLELTLYGYYGTTEVSNETNNIWPYEDRYKLVILNQKDTQGNKLDNLSRSDMSISEIKFVKCQCIQREMEILRTLTTDGIIRNTTPKNYLYWLFTNSTGDLGQISGEDVKYNCSLYPPNNEDSLDQLIIPAGTKIMHIPKYIQYKSVGIYKGNIGTFMQKMYTVDGNDVTSSNTVYVYPLYNKDMYDETQPPKTRLMIFYPANHLWDSAENNFKVDGDTVKLIASGKMQMQDDGENTLIDTGAGYITNNPMSVLTQNLDVQSDTAQFEPDSSLNAIHIQDKRDGHIYTPFIPNMANEYVIQSELARNVMCSYIVKWRYCDMNKIYPGMPVCIVRSTSRDDIIEIKGSVQATYSRWDSDTKTFTGLINIMAEKWSLNQNLEGWSEDSDESTNRVTGTESVIYK